MKIRRRKQKKELAGAIKLARGLLRDGKYRETYQFLQEAIEQFPADPELRLLYATILLEFRPDDVAAHASKAVSLAPHDPQILVRAAHLMFNRGEVEDARSCAVRVSELAHADFVFMSDLVNLTGLLAAFDEEHDLAEEELRSALEDEPTNGSFAVDLVRFLAAQDRSTEAIEIIDHALACAKNTETLKRVRREIAPGA